MSEKKISDFLHYYIGCEVIGNYNDEPRKGYLTGVQNGGYECEIQFFEEDGFNVFEEPEFNESKDVKLCLSRLEDITEEDWIKCFGLSRGVVDQHYENKTIQRLSTTERMIVLGKCQFVFGYHNCSDNDVRLGNGISFYLKTYLIKEELSVSESGIQAGESLFNDPKTLPVLNVVHIIHYLLSKGYDLFGLIEAGLAIDKKTLQS